MRFGSIAAFSALLFVVGTYQSSAHEQGHHRHFWRKPIVIAINLHQKIVLHRFAGAEDTYSGGIRIVRNPGVGMWSYGTQSKPAAAIVSMSLVKIIDVTALKANSACAFERNVCVIRP